ncbi:hypothetical protein [Rubrivirga marina]|uniref:Tetratricopeptide repeat protein n=1 Tax=Rubrivirga marina TaxID=1196024 RepID=A0A271J1L0_9BACT|nr:hypothetical protein [Rubrivirga marina]PAP77343.1 hypothetical protein BSZ37_13320 [Rubrivirga marina]
MRTLVLLLLVAVVPVAAQDLGETEFANTGAEEAQEPFLRGLLLLHSFEYDDAREAFQEARRIDPDFAMAAWGEAMTHNHPVWMQQDRDAALEALDGVDAMPASARERAYLATLDALYRGDASKEDRDDAYAEAMRQLAAAYPDDLDARAFHALSVLGTAHEGRDFTTYMTAAAVAEEVFDENPQHPGAAHYLIHAYDDPVHAPLGLRPARVYAEVAPAASHALHMPSHIYLALGMWEDVERMNRRSYAAAKAGTDRRGEPLNGHGWHALWWWHYAADQLQDQPLADSLYALAEAHYAEDSASYTPLAHVVRIRAQQQPSNEADPILSHEPPDTQSLSTLAIDALARGERLADTEGSAAARPVLAALQAAIAADDDPGWQARASALQLEAYLDLLDGDPDRALDLVREAAALEAAAPLTFGPPTPTTPAHEFLGLLLLEYGDDPAEAAEAYRTSLSRAPNRRQSAYGLERAQRAVERAAQEAGDSR